MTEKIYDKLLNDYKIKKIYDEIECLEDKEGCRAHHNFDHIMNVTNLVESLLAAFNYDKEIIAKAKIACLFHDVGALQGKDNHAHRSYIYAKKYFYDNNIIFEGVNDVLDAIRIHSDGFDSNNIIALVLILADKLDIKKSRITNEGRKVVGNRQYAHIEDIKINIENNNLIINFLTDNNINLKETNEYYFTKKVFKAIEMFSNKMNLKYTVLIDDKNWIIE